MGKPAKGRWARRPLSQSQPYFPQNCMKHHCTLAQRSLFFSSSDPGGGRLRYKPNSYHFAVPGLSPPRPHRFRTPSTRCSYGEQPTTHKEPSPGIVSQPVSGGGTEKQGRQKGGRLCLLPWEMQPSNLHTIKHKAHRQSHAKMGGGRGSYKPLRRVAGEQLLFARLITNSSLVLTLFLHPGSTI